MRRYRRRGFERNKGSLQCQVILRMHLNPFMDEVGIEVVGQGDIGDRGVRLRTFGNDLGIEGFEMARVHQFYVTVCGFSSTLKIP